MTPFDWFVLGMLTAFVLLIAMLVIFQRYGWSRLVINLTIKQKA